MNPAIETLDIQSLTTNEKLTLMDRLWDELSKQPEEIEVPERHFQILEERQRKLDAGETSFVPWEEAKGRILQKTVNRLK